VKLRPEKCALFQKSTTFLGHIVSDRGIQTDPKKIEAVQEWHVARSVRNVRSFFGLASYYRRFVPGFASIAGPSTPCWVKERNLSGALQNVAGAVRVCLTIRLNLW